jgi:uncharacterized membrane protein YqjE
MPPVAPDSAGVPAPGLLGSARRLARTALGILSTRLQIVGTELEEEQVRFVELLLVVAAVVFCFATATLLAVILVVLLLWETYKLATLGVFTALFVAAGVFGLLVLQRRRRMRPRFLSATVGEIAKDLERLREEVRDQA